MIAHQRMIASDGYEVMLFPLPYMYISQGENGNYSHQGTYNIDFLGWGANGRIYQAPMYAPCTCRCVATIDVNNNGRIFQSLNKVHTPNGLQYVTFMCVHDNNPIASIGDTFIQGDIFAHTGTAGNVTGDHTHFNCANGTYAGWENVPPLNHGQLKNSTHIYNICYINDTVIVDGLNYNWITYNGNINPKKKFNNKFPWVLYVRKLRKKHIF